MKKKLSLLMVALVAIAAFALEVGNRATGTSWTVAGNNAEVFGTTWDPTNVANDMTLDGDVYKLTKTGVTLAAGSVDFKICKDHAWDEAYPASDYKLEISEAGKYTLEFSFNVATETVSATATKTGDAVVEDKIVLAGTFNSWSETATMTKGEGNVWTAEIDASEITEDIQFKLVVNGGWKGATSAVNISAPEGWIEGTDNWILKHTITRYKTYTVTATCAGSVATEADWTVTIAGKDKRTKDVVISPASGDISEAINAELGTEYFAKNVTINLAENGAYTLSGTIKAGGSVTINGNGSTIDASTGDNIVGIDGVAGFAKKADETDSDHSLVNAITFKDVTITGMQKALVRDLMTKTLLETLTIDNCVMQVSNAKPFIDFDGRGYVGKVVVKNSTLWASAPTEKNFAKYGSRPKNVNEALNQEFDIQNSTIVNIGAKADFSGGQNFNNLKQNGTANNIYTLKNNIFVNCGKSGQVVVGFNNGQTSATPVWDVDKNAFNWNGADVAAAEVTKAGQKSEADIVKNCVAGVVVFADAANGDFTLGDCAQYTAKTGDPRWISAKTPKDVTIAATDITGGDIMAAITAAESALAYNESIGNLTITLAENGAYTLSGTIKAGGSVTINGNGSTIDASTGDNIVGIDGVAGFAKKADETDSDHSLVNAITFKDVTITGMQKALVRDLMTKTLLETLTIDNCVMQVSNAKPFIDFDGRGYVGKVVVKNSTLWASAPTEKNFAKYGSRPKNVNEALNQEFDIQNSTIVNIGAKADFSGGQNFNNLKQNGTANNIYTLKNNIFVNCGKSGQVVVGFNNGQTSATPVWDVDKNAFNWNGADVAAAEVTKAGQKSEADIVKNCVAGVVVFADAANGDFTLGDCAQYTAKTGDPRWISAKTPKDVTIAATDITDGDITAAVSAAEGALAYNETVGNITITLDKTVAYKVTAPIVACGNITINGNGAEIDASALDGNFTQMAAVENPTEWTAADVTIKGITVKGLKKALFFSACKNYVAENFIIDDCVVEQAADATTIDYTKGSTAKNITVTNSTFYAPTATTKSFYSSQSGQKYTEYDTTADAMQTFKFTGNTMYNLAPGKNFFSHRQSNQKWMTYDVKNNIFVDCGKSGQVIKGMNGGQGGANPVWDIDGNVFNFKGADTSASEVTGDEAEPVKNSIAGRVLFKDAAKGDFGGQFVLAPTTSMPEAIGDPRWTLTSAASFAINIALGIENGTVTTTPAGYAAKDEVVTIKGTPASGFSVESYSVKNGEESVSVGADATFKMPESEVLVSAVFSKAPVDIAIAAADITGGDITAAIAAKKAALAEGETVGNITITLAEGTYTVSSPIEAPASLTINGAAGAVIDASALEAALITTPAGDLALWKEASLTVKDVTIKGVKKGVYASAGKNYLYNDFQIDNCVIEIAATNGLEFDFRKGGVAKNFTINKSTIYAPEATTNSLYTSQSAQKGTEAPGVTVQTFAITNSTLYNLAKGKNFFTHRQSNQKWLAYTIKNSVFLNVGKSGQVVKGINQGQSGANPTWDIDGNIFNFEGKDTSADETTGDEAEPVKNSVAGRVAFTDAAAGNFGGKFVLAPTTTSMPEAIGDPRWTLTTSASYTITVGDCTGGTVTADKPYAAEGEKVYPTFTPAEGYSSSGIVPTVKNDADEDVTSSIKFGEDESGSYLIMPAFNITVSVVFQALDMTTLDATIATAEGMLEGKDATVADSPEKTLSDAIAAAKAAKAAAKSQAEVDAANTALETAIETYKTATGINAISVDGVSGDIFSDGKPVYNLSGQRVFKGYKGIVIKNGRKIVVK